MINLRFWFLEVSRIATLLEIILQSGIKHNNWYVLFLWAWTNVQALILSVSADGILDLSVYRHDHSDKYHFPEGMQRAGVLPHESYYPPCMDGGVSTLLKHFPFSVLHCSMKRYQLLSGIYYQWGNYFLLRGMVKRKGLNEGDNCSRNSWMLATDFLVSFIQLARIQNLPAMLLGSTRLCNKKGKHSMSVVQVTHVATGLFLMILIKPGPFLSISQKGKRLDRLHIFVVYESVLHSDLAEGGNTGCFFQLLLHLWKLHFIMSRMRNLSPSCFADTEALTFVWCLL